MELTEKQDDPNQNADQGSEPDTATDPTKNRVAQPRKPFDTPLPDIKPLPGEPKKWWNPDA
jgi:hypothetical protein